MDLATKNASLKASWIDRIRFNNGAPNRFGILKELLPMPSPLIWGSNIKPGQVKKIAPPGFARDLWESWAIFNYKKPIDETEADVDPVKDLIMLG